ncbi:hypothetical protein HA466_0313600 [Hirschfeldia incana]|nr:hypothetical protein HA466_0313600 [Hirschfeldia incana]
MIWRWWDPGIDEGNQIEMGFRLESQQGMDRGFSEKGILSDLGDSYGERIKGCSWIIGLIFSMENRKLVSRICTRRSHGYKGIIFVYHFFTKIERFHLRSGNKRIRFPQKSLILEGSRLRIGNIGEIDSQYICHYIFRFNLRKDFRRFPLVTVVWGSYKFDNIGIHFFICFASIILFLLFGKKGFTFAWVIMSQSQLVGSKGDARGGEGSRKRLKVSVPHFDNSALIRSCSKVLLGRCMIPVEKEMKALLKVSIPHFVREMRLIFQYYNEKGNR